MALINTQIQPSKFEAIRDRIALILAMELENQFVTFGDYELDLDVWTERGEKIDNSECPAIIVSLASGDFSSQHQGSYLGEYTYNVDIYSSKVTDDEDYGSTLSTIALHKIAGVCTKIIEDPQYKTLGFQAPSISHREVSNMIIAPPDPNDAAYVAVGRLVVKVNVVEGTELLNALNFEGADTSVKLYNTNKGLLYSGSGYDPPIPSNQVQLLVNGDEFTIIDGGESFDLPVVDQDGNEVGQQIGNEFVVQVDGGAVNSVNGQTGDVDLDADDIDETSTRFWLTDVLKTAYDAAVTWISTNGTNLINHLSNTSNPHNTTAAQVGAPSGSGTSTGTNTGDQDLSPYALITTLANYVTITALNTALSAYVTVSSLASTLANYVTNSSLASTLSSYATQSWVTTQLNSLSASRVLHADNNTYLITGGTGEVIGVSKLIPANTLSADKSLEVRCRVLRVSGTAGVITPRIRFSTSATPSPVNSATQIANGVQIATGNFWQQMKRTFARKTSNSLEVFNATIQLADDDVQTTAAASTVTFDTTVDQWLHFTIQNSNAADTSAISHISIILI